MGFGMSYNKCPHPSCTEQKPVVFYACKKHWFELPESIRYKIYNGSRDKEVRHLRLEGHREAKTFWGLQ